MTHSSFSTSAGPQARPYFHHADRRRTRQSGTISPVTRYLCGAAYVDERFVEQVIGELIEDEQRAVAPSYGYDLEPVVRHCFRARRLWLAQNAVLTALLIAGLCAIGKATIIAAVALALIALPVGVLGAERKHRKAGITALIGLVILVVLAILIERYRPGSTPGYAATGYGTTGYAATASAGPSAKLLLLEVVLLILALGATFTWSRHTMLRTLTTDLAPGTVHRPPPLRGKRVEDRLETVARAQRGNVTMHGVSSPFLGAGNILQSWSVVVELLPGNGDGEPLVDPVDPVALNRYVKRRLAALRSSELPERQRISGLTVRDYVVTSGLRWRDFPLLDPDRVPYEMASAEAVEAIIRHPQASARHFLRATTGTEGKVVTVDGQPLLLAEDQEVQVSAFVHIAVEGGLLYVEYAATFLGAVKDEYHDIDDLPTNPQNLWGRAIMDALRRLPAGSLLAPVNLIRGVYRAVAVNSRMNGARRRSAEAVAYNYGARESIRQSSSSAAPDTYTRRLDAHKYAKLIERRVNDAVLDYLDSQGVDTSEYRARTNVIHNHNMYVQDSTIYGSVAYGDGATATTYSQTHATVDRPVAPSQWAPDPVPDAPTIGTPTIDAPAIDEG